MPLNVLKSNPLTAMNGVPLFGGIDMFAVDDIRDPNDTSPLVHTCLLPVLNQQTNQSINQSISQASKQSSRLFNYGV